MENSIKVGIVIADNDEYTPLLPYVERFGGKPSSVFGLLGHEFLMPAKNGTLHIHAVLCGTGKVNAATATAFLIDRGANMILNTGLSGGLSGVRRGDIVLADRLLEHDFDLQCLGYKLAEKPGQEYIYTADERLNRHFMNLFPELLSGTMVCGDCFVSDDALRERLKSEFSAVACDMESAAAAYPAHLGGVPFCAVRRISDDAGDDAKESYRAMYSLAESCLLDLVLKGLSALDVLEFSKN